MTDDRDNRNATPARMLDIRPKPEPLPVDGTKPAGDDGSPGGAHGDQAFDVHEAARRAVGEQSAEFARYLAEADFPAFKSGMRSIGFPTLFDDEMEGLTEGRTPLHGSRMPQLANITLCMRYPFLVPRSRWTDKVVWYEDITDTLWDEERNEAGRRAEPFATTELDAMPLGWMARYGLEICEDILSLLRSSSVEGATECYRIDQIKEKWGYLHWYDSCVAEDVYGDLSLLVSFYEKVSERVCIGCGGFHRVRTTGGWISHECLSCRSQSQTEHALRGEAIIRHYNSLVKEGKLGKLVHAQPEWWKERNADLVDRGEEWEEVDFMWRIPYGVECLVATDILDETSHPIGTIEDDRMHVVLTWDSESGGDAPIRHETDLMAWASERGLLVADVARNVDRSRRYLDADTNLPEPQGGDASEG